MAKVSMKIKSVTTMTKYYRSPKGNEYQIVQIEFDEAPENLQEVPGNLQAIFSNPMYGTINYKYITDEKLNTPLTLASMCIEDTIPKALIRRTDMEECEGMTLEEICEYYKAKYAKEQKHEPDEK